MICSTIADEEPTEADKDFAKPLVSDPIRPIVPERVLDRAVCSTIIADGPRDPVRFFAIPLV